MEKIQTNLNTHNIGGNPKCPICSYEANVGSRKDGNKVFEGWCQGCGNIRVTFSAVDEAKRRGLVHLVAAWLRKNPLQVLCKPIEIEDLDRIFKDSPNYLVTEKLDLMLNAIATQSAGVGQKSNFQAVRDYPLCYAKDQGEAFFYMKELAKLGFVTQDTGIAEMTIKGYQKIEELTRASRQSDFAFVAMWFEASTNAVYDDAIAPGIRDAGYEPIRVDRVEHTNRIDDEIIGRIRGNRFMVADFTGQRQGVYFEAGMMLGLGRTVIWMCSKAELNSVHFDTRQYNFIDYESTTDAKTRLYNRILAIEGEGARQHKGTPR